MIRRVVKRTTAILGICLIGLASASALGCENEAVVELRRELEKLKAKVTALEQRSEELETVKTELAALREKPPAPVPTVPPAGDVQPITPAQYSPTGNEVDDPFIGKADASVVLVEFADYQCKPCAQFYQNTFAKLRREYFDSGKVKFIFRDFPLASNASAAPAAQAAQCAGEQGAYWEMHSYLFEHPDALKSGTFDDAVAISRRLDKDKFRACLKSNRYADEIIKDSEDGTTLGVRGAPAFFIGKKLSDGNYKGVLVRGAQPVGVFRSELGKILEAK